jgi:nucleotide-binding universal stress UspA family protein
MAAIPMAFGVAEKFNAKIELLNVVEMYAYDVQDIEPVALSIDEKNVYGGLKGRLKTFFEDHEDFKFTIEDGKEDFEDVLVRQDEDGEVKIEYKSVILKSVVAHHEIVDYANENADLVVMSTHGRTGLSRMLLGSTTEQVIQHLEKPQITIKPDLED